MAGHSKFKNIQYRKDSQDKKRNKVFTKLLREINTAVKIGNDPNSNFRLRNSLINARSFNVPKHLIDKALDINHSDSKNYISIRYEGYALGGVAFIAEALTDNRNRTAGEVRAIFTKYGGQLSESGSVSFMFKNLGLIQYYDDIDSFDNILEMLVKLPIEDVIRKEGYYNIYTLVTDYANVNEHLISRYGDPKKSYIAWVPKIFTTVDSNQYIENLFKLSEDLENNDDIQNVFCNLLIEKNN